MLDLSVHFLSLTKTKCFPCSFGAYFPFFHSSKRKLHKRLLFSSLHKNFFQSRGTLGEGPFTRCACEEPLLDRSNPFIERVDRSLLQSQRVVLWVVVEKHTQLALRTCSEAKPLLAAKHFRLLCSIEISQWSLGQVRFVLQAMH